MKIRVDLLVYQPFVGQLLVSDYKYEVLLLDLEEHKMSLNSCSPTLESV